MEEPKILLGLDLSVASREVIEILIEDASEQDIFDEIARANKDRHEILEFLLQHPGIPEQVKSFINGILQAQAKTPEKEAAGQPRKEARPQNLMQRIQGLSVGERLQLALKGGKEIRGILIKDTNKEVMLSVIENQKITEPEIEMIAKSRSVPEEMFRRIAKNREWLKNYGIAFALVTNPKTPPGIAMTLISSLKFKDLVKLEKDKNVSELVRSSSKKLVSARRPK